MLIGFLFLVAVGAFLSYDKDFWGKSPASLSAEVSQSVEARLGALPTQHGDPSILRADSGEDAHKIHRLDKLVASILLETDSDKIPDILARANLSPEMKQSLIQRQQALFKKALANEDTEAIQENIYVMNAVDPETVSLFAQEFFEDFAKYSRNSDASRITRSFVLGVLLENKSKVNIRRALELFQWTCKSPTDCAYEQGLILSSAE